MTNSTTKNIDATEARRLFDELTSIVYEYRAAFALRKFPAHRAAVRELLTRCAEGRNADDFDADKLSEDRNVASVVSYAENRMMTEVYYGFNMRCVLVGDPELFAAVERFIDDCDPSTTLATPPKIKARKVIGDCGGDLYNVVVRYNNGSDFEHKVTVAVEGVDAVTAPDVILGIVWRQFNHVDGTEYVSGLGVRSMMVGDDVEIDGTTYRCLPCGWQRVD